MTTLIHIILQRSLPISFQDDYSCQYNINHTHFRMMRKPICKVTKSFCTEPNQQSEVSKFIIYEFWTMVHLFKKYKKLTNWFGITLYYSPRL